MVMIIIAKEVFMTSNINLMPSFTYRNHFDPIKTIKLRNWFDKVGKVSYGIGWMLTWCRHFLHFYRYLGQLVDYGTSPNWVSKVWSSCFRIVGKVCFVRNEWLNAVIHQKKSFPFMVVRSRSRSFERRSLMLWSWLSNPLFFHLVIQHRKAPEKQQRTAKSKFQSFWPR